MLVCFTLLTFWRCLTREALELKILDPLGVKYSETVLKNI